MTDRPDPPPKKIEHSPEAVAPIKRGHVRVLEHMLNHRLGKAAQIRPKPLSGYLMAEIGALSAAIATLNELLDARDAQS
jgi:hypothetical protein